MVTVGDSAPTLIDEEEEDEESDEGEEEVVERTNKPKSVWFGGSLSTDTGNRIFKELLAPNVWEFPKSVELLKNCVRMGMGNQGIALDFFAGSGTLAQSIFELNIEDGGSRKCLSVQLPQAIETKTKIGKAATSFLTSVGLPSRLTEITKERIRRSAAKVKSENPLFHSDLGFRIFKLDSTNIRPWEPNRDKLTETLDESVEHIKAGRTDQDILFEILLKLGLELTVPIETRSIASKTVYSVGLGTLLVCLAESIQATEVESLALGIVDWHTALAPAVESTVVFRDSAFADDVAKSNLTAILAQHGLENVRSL
jgi:adenine-specific DNA-methyltransferase